jgi:hypothetical protein
MKSYTDSRSQVHYLFGRELGYELRGKSPAQRAVMAAQYLANGGHIVLHVPTKKQLAALFRVSGATLDAAKALNEEERALVDRRNRPPIARKLDERREQGKRHATKGKDGATALSDDAVENIVAQLGVERIWRAVDKLTQPPLPLVPAE